MASGQDYINEALDYGIPRDAIDAFLAINYNSNTGEPDYSRIMTALSPDYEPGGAPRDSYVEGRGYVTPFQSSFTSAPTQYPTKIYFDPGSRYETPAPVLNTFLSLAGPTKEQIAAQWIASNGPEDAGRMTEALGPEYADIQARYLAQRAGLAAPTSVLMVTNHLAPLGSMVTTLGATLPQTAEPTSGPTGLAYAADPVNYATMEQSPNFGYVGETSGTYPTSGPLAVFTPAPAAPAAGGAAVAANNTTMYLVLAGMAVAAYFLLK